MKWLPFVSILKQNLFKLLIAFITGAFLFSFLVLKQNAYHISYYENTIKVSLDLKPGDNVNADSLKVKYAALIGSKKYAKNLYDILLSHFSEIDSWSKNVFFKCIALVPLGDRCISFENGFDDESITIKIKSPVFISNNKFQQVFVDELNNIVDLYNIELVAGGNIANRISNNNIPLSNQLISNEIELLFLKIDSIFSAISKEKFKLFTLGISNKNITNFFKILGAQNEGLDYSFGNNQEMKNGSIRNIKFYYNNNLMTKLLNTIYSTQELLTILEQEKIVREEDSKKIYEKIIKLRAEAISLNEEFIAFYSLELLQNGRFSSSNILPKLSIIPEYLGEGISAFEKITIVKKMILVGFLGGLFFTTFITIVITVNYLLNNKEPLTE